jgi:hypothetical protein
MVTPVKASLPEVTLPFTVICCAEAFMQTVSKKINKKDLFFWGSP